MPSTVSAFFNTNLETCLIFRLGAQIIMENCNPPTQKMLLHSLCHNMTCQEFKTEAGLKYLVPSPDGTDNIIQFQISMVRLVRVVGEEENKEGECLARSVTTASVGLDRERKG